MEATRPATFTLHDQATSAPNRLCSVRVPPQPAAEFGSQRAISDRAAAFGQVEVRSINDHITEGFLAAVCHELRSPIGAIRNAVKVLRSPGHGKILDQSDLCDLIDRQAQQMAFLVAGLLDFTGIARGELTLQRELVDLSIVLRNAVETVGWDLKRHNHSLTVSGPESGVWLMADAAKLEQVFVNLLSNASKYTDAGGKIALSLHVSDGSAIVRIQDSGIGIAPDVLPHIFELLMQVAPAALRSGSGLGIGLALARAIVETHGGNVAAVSAGLGHGSEFTVRLPLHKTVSPMNSSER